MKKYLAYKYKDEDGLESVQACFNVAGKSEVLDVIGTFDDAAELTQLIVDNCSYMFSRGIADIEGYANLLVYLLEQA